MLVLDTDHLRELMVTGPSTVQLRSRLKASNQVVATTIVSVQETIEGLLKGIHNNTKTASKQLLYYEELGKLITFYATWTVLPFDGAAVATFEELRSRKLRSIGPDDLRIAAITLSRNATLLSANLRHFRLVTELDVQDWLHPPQ